MKSHLATARLAYAEGRERPRPGAIGVAELVVGVMAEFSEGDVTA